MFIREVSFVNSYAISNAGNTISHATRYACHSPGGGTVSIANYYLPSVPFSVSPRKTSVPKAKKQKKGADIGYVKGTTEGQAEQVEEDQEEDTVVEMSDYEKARAERVARNNAYLKSLGLA